MEKQCFYPHFEIIRIISLSCFQHGNTINTMLLKDRLTQNKKILKVFFIVLLTSYYQNTTCTPYLED